jgi:hypothetical protein
MAVERLFDVRKTGQAAPVYTEWSRGERVYPMQEQLDLTCRSRLDCVRPFGVSHMLEQALVRLDQSAQHLTVDADVLEKLKFPRETIQVRLMIRRTTDPANPSWRGAAVMTTQEDPRRGESGFIRQLQRKRWRFSPFG